MKLRISLNHIVAQPGSILLDAQFAALCDDVVERLIDAVAVLVFVDERAHGVAHVYLFGEDDEALHRTIPQNIRLVAKTVPGEDAVAVSQQQAVDT